MSDSTVTQVVEQLRKLPDDLQHRVLEFVQYLGASARRGTAGHELLRFAGAIPSGDLHVMREAVEGGCEQVDPDAW